jgi:hypothetical protein
VATSTMLRRTASHEDVAGVVVWRTSGGRRRFQSGFWAQMSLLRLSARSPSDFLAAEGDPHHSFYWGWSSAPSACTCCLPRSRPGPAVSDSGSRAMGVRREVGGKNSSLEHLAPGESGTWPPRHIDVRPRFMFDPGLKRKNGRRFRVPAPVLRCGVLAGLRRELLLPLPAGGPPSFRFGHRPAERTGQPAKSTGQISTCPYGISRYEASGRTLNSTAPACVARAHRVGPRHTFAVASGGFR